MQQIIEKPIMKSVWTFNTTINAPLEEVKKKFFDVREGEFSELTAPFLTESRGACKVTFDKVMYTVLFADKHLEYIMPEPEENRIAIQGEWWYRGEYTLSAFVSSSISTAPDTVSIENTKVQLEVFNLADQEWMVSLMNIGAKRKHEIAFMNLCKMAERLIDSAQ